MTTLFTALHVIRFRNERGECELLLLQAAHRRLHRGDRGELPSAEERESLRVQAAHRRLHRGAQSRASRRLHYFR